MMPAIEHMKVNTGTTPQIRELLRTIVDAATALAQLLPDKELEQGFEFPWGHFLFIGKRSRTPETRTKLPQARNEVNRNGKTVGKHTVWIIVS